MRTVRLFGTFTLATFLACSVWAGDVPRSARLVKDAGNQFLAAKKYPDAIDCYFQALQICPSFPEAHYNLGVAFLKGYKALALAMHHFEKYLDHAPDADDRESVEALVAALGDRADPVPEEEGHVIGVIAGRLLVSGSNWVKSGDRIEVANPGEAPCACLLADYVYSDCVLTQRIWDRGTLDLMKPGLVAVNVSDRVYGN